MTRLADLPWPRRTDHLVIRPASPGDLDSLWRYWRLPEVVRWTGGSGATRAGLTERLEDPERRARRVVAELDGVVVGDAVLFPRDGWAQEAVRERAAGAEAEIGYALDPAYGGRGLATELVGVLVDACLSPAPHGLGLRRVTAGCFVANEPSWRLMERLGMRREQHGVKDSLHAEHGWLDGFTYALLAEEWPVAARGAPR